MSDRPLDPPSEDPEFWSEEPTDGGPLGFEDLLGEHPTPGPPPPAPPPAPEPAPPHPAPPTPGPPPPAPPPAPEPAPPHEPQPLPTAEETTRVQARPTMSADETTPMDTPAEETVALPRLQDVTFEPRPVQIRATSAPPSYPKTRTLSKRRFLTLEAFAEALIPPGGIIPLSASDVGVAIRIDAALATFEPKVRTRISKLLWTWEWMSVFTRTLRPFSRLPAHAAIGVVERASKSKVLPRRQAFSFLKIFVMNQWASTPPVEQATGFTYACVTKDPPLNGSRLEVVTGLTKDHVEECDVVIVGSGAGGAVMAKELAEVGLNVVVLEEGGYFTRDDFAGPPWERLQRMYRAQGTTVALGRPVIPLPMGKAVGGSTLVNSGSCFRIPDRVLTAWGSDLGIDDLDPGSMRVYFERVEKILHVKQVPEELLGSNARTFRVGATALGVSGGNMMRNIQGCRGCGVCAFGCPSDAKQSTHISYLPRAQRHGATVYARTRADRVIVDEGRARGVEATLLDDKGNPKAKLRVDAKVVVLAAGSVYTPMILSASALGNRSGQLGRNLRIHPAAGIGALFEEDIFSWRGTLQPYFVDEWQTSHDLMIEVTSILPGVGAGSFPGTGQSIKDLVANSRHLASAGVFVSDTSKGRVRRVGKEPVVTYALNKVDTRKLVSGISKVAEIMLAAGAKNVLTGLPGLPSATSRSDLQTIKEEGVRPGALKLTAFHPVGTARMGTDPVVSVVDPWGEVHGVNGLFVADASVFPGCPTVNPMVGIMAFATRTADHLVRRGEGYF